jgi:hypothetical protein
VPVNRKQSDLYINQRLGAVDLLPGARNGNKLDVTLAQISAAAGDDATSTFQVATFSPDVFLHELDIRHAAIAGATSMTLSAVGATKPLMVAQDMTVAGTKDGMLGVAIADRILPLWRMLGLALRPAAPIDLVFTTNANITGAGLIIARAYHSSSD